jgi:Flp pilus assembly protein TadG
MKSKFRFLSLLSRFGKDKQASGPRLLARLLRDEEGSYLLIMALAIPVFIGLAGLATEGALIFYNHRTVQSAVDAAAYSAAVAYSIDGSADITTQAQAIVANYGFVVGTSNNQANVVATVDTTTYSPLTAINVTVTRPQLPILSGIWVNNPFNVSGSAKALISGGAGGGNGNCILGLAPTGTAITLQGNVNVNAAQCGIFSNSDISLGGTASITAGSVGAAGSVSVRGNSNIGPPPNGYTQGDNPVINPYAAITVPTPGTCIDGPPPGLGNPPTAPLNPGTYCNPINCIPSSSPPCASVTLNPGTYILKNSQLIVMGSTLTGKGVTLVFTDPGGAAYPNGPGGSPTTAMNISGATIDLEAPASGATLGIPGMLILGDTNMPTSTNFTLSANGGSTGISGVIYLPDGNFWGGGPIIAGGCTQMIAYKVTLQRDAIFNNSNCDLSASGGGGAKPIGNVVTLVK